MLDELECETLRKQVVKVHGTTKHKVGNFFSSSNPLVFVIRWPNKLKISAIDLTRLQLIGISLVFKKLMLTHLRDSGVRDSYVILREHDKEKIINLLMQQSNPNDDTSSSVIPIVGIGGMGKTTLAKFVFNDEMVHGCFPLKMWVCVSDDFDIKQLIIKIINSANDLASADAPPCQQNLSMLDLEQLKNQLANNLDGQKFSLVLDDMWNEDRVKWAELRDLIQVGAAGSKILVTTRSQRIDTMMGTHPSPITDGLSPEDSLSLFVKWAFKEGEEKHLHLINIGREIVKKCEGIPLALRTLGSLLFLKLEANEWEHVRDNEIWNLPQKEYDILPALKLSYDLMPSYLRQCFALFSLEETWLWGALGLLASSQKNWTLEDVANQHLYELLSRSLLQDFDSYATLYVFKIHDLVHDLAIFAAKDECLPINSNIQNIPQNVRHLSFAENSLVGNLFATKSIAVRIILFPYGIVVVVDGISNLYMF